MGSKLFEFFTSRNVPSSFEENWQKNFFKNLISSITELQHHYERTKRVKEQRPELFISVIGTKVDLQEDVLGQYRHKGIDDVIADIGPDAPHVLTSARHNMNVNEAFESGLGNFAPSIIPNEDTIKRLGKLMKKNKRRWCFSCCCVS